MHPSLHLWHLARVVTTLATVSLATAHAAPKAKTAPRGTSLSQKEPSGHAAPLVLASTPVLSYQIGQQYSYNVDFTCTQVFSTTTTGSTLPSTSNQTQATRTTGVIRLTPLALRPADASHPSPYFVHKVSIPGSSFAAYRGDGSGTWFPTTVDTTALTQDFVVEQTQDGHITALKWTGVAPDLNSQNVRNTLKGLVGLLDFGLPASAASPRVETCTDVLGTYSATFTLSSTVSNQIQLSKNNYVATAPNVAVYQVDGETWTPVPQTSVVGSGQHLLTLNADGSNTMASRHITNETIKLASTNPSLLDGSNPTSLTRLQDGGSFAASGSVTISGDLTYTGKQADSTAGSFNTAAFVQSDSLQAIVAPSRTRILTNMGIAAGENLVAAGIAKSADPKAQLEGATLIARGLQQGASLNLVKQALLDPKTAPAVAEALALALGGHRSAESRELARQALTRKNLPETLKEKVLQALVAVPVAEPELVDAIESFARGNSRIAPHALYTLASMVPAIEKDQPARARDIVNDLMDRLESATTLRAKAELLSSLAATRSRHAAPALAAYSGDSSLLGRVASQGLTALEPVMSSITSKNYCDLLNKNAMDQSGGFHDVSKYTSTLKYCTDPARGINTLISKSVGTNFMGGTAWAGYGVGANFSGSDAKAAMVVASGLQANVLWTNIDLLDAEVYALYDSKDAKNSFLFWNYNVMGVPGSASESNDDQPDDPHYAPARKSYRTAFYRYDTGPIPVLFFFVEFWAGVGLDSGVEGKHNGFADPSQPMYVIEAPYTSISAWAGASAGWWCLNVSLELEGQFLNTSIPVRLDIDKNHLTNGHPNYCVDANLQIVPWYLALTASFNYCIGSEKKLLWSDSARPEFWALSTFCDPEADLTVKELAWNPSDNPDTSKPITFNVTIQNISSNQTNPDPTRHILTQLFVDSTKVGEFLVQDPSGNNRPLASGESFTKSIVWPTPTAGTHTVKVIVDPDPGAQNNSNLGIPDSNLANNTLTATLVVQPVLPDLVVATALASPTTNGGTQANLNLTFGNTGPGKNPGVMTKVYGIANKTTALPMSSRGSKVEGIINDPGDGSGGTGFTLVWSPTPVPFSILSADGKNTVLYQGTVSYPPAGASDPVTATFPVPANHLIHVVVNPAAAIKEKSPSNNTMFNVDVTNPNRGVPTVALNGPFVTTFTDWAKENQSWMTAITEKPGVRIDRVEWYLDGSLVSLVRANAAQSLGVGSVNVPFSINVADSTFRPMPAGTHTLQAKAFAQAGDTGSSPVVSFTVRHPDLIPPDVTCNPPTDMNRSDVLTANGLITLSALASDATDGVDHVDYYFDGNNDYFGQTLRSSTAPYSVQIPNDARLAFGFHFLFAKAFDKANQEIPGVSLSNIRLSPTIPFRKSTEMSAAEPNNTLAQANPTYPYTTSVKGSAASSSDMAYFKVACAPGQQIILGGSSYLKIFDASGVLRGNNWVNGDGTVGFDGVNTHLGPVSPLSWTNTSTSNFVYVLAQGYDRWKRNAISIDNPDPTYSTVWSGRFNFTIKRSPETTVTVSPAEVTVNLGGSALFSANVTQTGIPGVTWSVSPSGGATISSSGLFTPTKSGSYTIVATSNGDYTKVGTAYVAVP